jgi:hypothetical protein
MSRIELALYIGVWFIREDILSKMTNVSEGVGVQSHDGSTHATAMLIGLKT